MSQPSREEQLRASLRKSAHVIQDLNKALSVYREPIAIIGMACRFPGPEGVAVDRPERYWQLLQAGREAIGELPAHRMGHTQQQDADQPILLKGGFLSEVEAFDAAFFDLSPREALVLDPQQRLLLEVAWEALEAAHIVPASLVDCEAGVFVGVYNDDYIRILHERAGIDAHNLLYAITGNLHSVTAGRVAYTLGWTGPAMAIDTACSSSLVALHQACQSLRNGECTLALAGGVHLILHGNWAASASLSTERMFAADGRCKTFDAAADGFGRAEGCGMVVLKRLSDAQAAGDNILAVIRGSMINQDGHSSGLTAPSGPSQQRVIRRALQNAGLEPEQVDYIEAHGTGTNLGDPIEIGALNAVFRHRPTPLWVGSVKTNLGHLEAAAGIASVIKVVLAMQHGQIPPHLNLHTPNPHIDWEGSPIQIPGTLLDWPHPAGAQQRVAGVSSFGISGTNAHVILSRPLADPSDETAPAQLAPERPVQLFTLAAKSEAALRGLVRKYQAFLETDLAADLGNLAYSTHVTRTHFAHRLALIAHSKAELQTKLAAYAQQQEQPGMVAGVLTQTNPQTGLAFLFTGQGSQYLNMGRELYTTEPTFRSVIDRCDEVLQACLGRSLLELLYPPTAPGHDDLMESHPCGQAANFALECALVDLWRAWGIQPTAVLGHSLGDFAAAYTAGVFSLEDGLRLVTERGRLMEQAHGSMVAVMAAADVVAPLIAPFADVAIGVINGPQSVVISGGHTHIAQITATLQAAGFKTRKLAIPVAAHSPMLDPMLDAFAAAVRKVTLSLPQCAVVSSMTGQLITHELTDPSYWCNHLRNTVRFADGVSTLRQQGCTVFLEIGPKPTLLGLAQTILEATPFDPPSTIQSPILLPSLREGQNDWAPLLTSLGALYTCGVAIDWEGLERPYQRRKVPLPTYAFQRQRYWVEAPPQRAGAALRPLIDKLTQSPALKETIFETAFSLADLPFLAEHQVYGQVVSPAACQLALVLSAAELIFGQDRALHLADVLLPQALVLPQDGARTTQAIFTPTAGNAHGVQYELKVISFVLDSVGRVAIGEAATHVTGYAVAAAHRPPGAVDLAWLRQQCDQPVDLTTFYQTLAAQQLTLGPSFRWLAQAWQGQTAATPVILAKLVMPAAVGRSQRQLLHPGLLDACFQVAGLGGEQAAAGATLLPFALAALQFYRPPQGESWWCHARQVAQHKWDIQLLDGQGGLLIDIRGFEVRAATPDAVYGAALWQDWLYQVEWQPRPYFGLPLDYLPAPAIRAAALRAAIPSLWAKDAGNQHQELSAALNALSLAYILAAFAKAGFSFQPAAHWRTDQIARQLGVVPSYHRLLERLLAILAEADILQRGEAHWLVLKQPTIIAPALQLERWPALYGDAPELTLLTRCGAQLLEALRGVQEPLELLFPGGDTTVATQLYTESAVAQVMNKLVQQVVQQVVAQLPPEQGLRILEIGAGTGGTTAGLLPLLSVTRTDYLFTDIGAAFLSKAQVRFAHYAFVRYQPLDIEHSPAAQGFGRGQADLVIAANVLHATRDLPETLAHIHQLLQPGGQLVLVESTSPHPWVDLTFGLTDGWWRFADSRQEHPLLSAAQWQTLLLANGFQAVECVEQDGQAIIVAQAARCAPKAPAHPLPAEPAEAWLLFADNQGIAAALREQLEQRGERAILVYAAQAYMAQDGQTFQLRPACAEDYQRLFAALPPVQGIVHLWSLDTPPFAAGLDLIDAAHQSCGTVLLLVQALLQAQITPNGLWLVTQNAQAVSGADSVSGVAQAGLWGMGKVIALEHPELNCGCIDLATMATPAGAAAHLCAEITTAAPQQQREAQVALRPAARYVARLARFAPQPATPFVCQPQATYLITGGLGGLGLATAAWLATQGATRLVLMGRSQPNAEAQEQLAALQARGVVTTVAQGDVTDYARVEELLNQIEGAYPLRGIIHAVGVLDDAALVQQSWARFAKVLAPKIQGACHLHELTKAMELDFFVLFSSAASLLGNPGQANHAAANAFLDAFAHYRQAHQQRALSINWGAWSTIGAAAELVRVHQPQMAAQGMGFITPAQGVATFGALLPQTGPQMGVLPITWSRYSQAEQRAVPFYAAFTRQGAELSTQPSAPQPASIPFRQQLDAASPGERQGLLVDHIQKTVAIILGMTASPAVHIGFTELGMDSLMTIELRRRLERSLQLTLPSTLAFEYPTAERLATYLWQENLAELFASESAAANRHNNGYPSTTEGADGPQLKHGNTNSTASATAPVAEQVTDDAVEARLRKLEALLKG